MHDASKDAPVITSSYTWRGNQTPEALRPSAQENRGYVQEHCGFASLETKKTTDFSFFLTSHKGKRKEKDPLKKMANQFKNSATRRVGFIATLRASLPQQARFMPTGPETRPVRWEIG
jgi:hypothetical protein